jgi:hypothetical protein
MRQERKDHFFLTLHATRSALVKGRRDERIDPRDQRAPRV